MFILDYFLLGYLIYLLFYFVSTQIMREALPNMMLGILFIGWIVICSTSIGWTAFFCFILCILPQNQFKKGTLTLNIINIVLIISITLCKFALYSANLAIVYSGQIDDLLFVYVHMNIFHAYAISQMGLIIIVSMFQMVRCMKQSRERKKTKMLKKLSERYRDIDHIAHVRVESPSTPEPEKEEPVPWT